MMEHAPENKKHYTIEEYFALLEQSEERFEYHNGKVCMMAGVRLTTTSYLPL